MKELLLKLLWLFKRKPIYISWDVSNGGDLSAKITYSWDYKGRLIIKNIEYFEPAKKA